MKENIELDLAWQFVNSTSNNIFLTGKAGTGKTTFLHDLKTHCKKRMVIVAPTGVAAINAKGVTIHSFFQMPFGPILPDADLNSSSGSIRKFNKTKINIIKSLDLLVIDEISMVRADLLDGIDKTLRRFKNRNVVFGGVQLLMIGDLNQLSPVIKENEWRLLSPFYKNAFFFSSKAYQESNAITIELKHIYRQENPLFINILNEIRNNQLSEGSAIELNKRYQPNFVTRDNDGYISLTTHNNKAKHTNNEALKKLKGKEYIYKAVIEGNFPEHLYPNSKELTLKVGAQVMFIKNDSSQDKRYFNGKIGTVISLEKDEVIVQCAEENFSIVTKLESWENIKYTIDSDSKAISENKVGSYTQIPLRLAWSITIHKSQGLTFEKAIIDADGAFAHGQTYVALSRCKSLEGLVLKNKITNNQIISDSNVTSFNNRAKANQPTVDMLQASRRRFQLELISEVFNFYEFLFPIERILDIYYKNRTSIEGNIEGTLLSIKTHLTTLLKISNTFNSQLASIGDIYDIHESNLNIQDRFVKATSYFYDQIKSNLEILFKTLVFTTDNKTIENDINKHIDFLEELRSKKLLYFDGLKDGFKIQKYLELRAKAVFLAKDKLKLNRKVVVDGTTNVELFELLRELRNNLAEREDLVHYQIFTQKSLYAMCEMLPVSKQELNQVHGMGKTRIEKYGSEILQVIKDYCEDNNIDTSVDSSVFKESEPKKQKRDTKSISLDLFKTGKSIDQISLERELTVNTIFGHLASFISSGEVKITDLMSKGNYTKLKKIIPAKSFENLSDLKHQLNDKYTYNELKLVLESLKNN